VRHILTIDRYRIFQIFKYSVYALLTLNVYLFFAEEWAASAHRFTDGIVLADLIEGYAATIDTAAWVILLLMFELETSVLDDRHFTKRVTWSLHGLRAFCYIFIVYAAYGYLAKLFYVYGASPLPNVSDLCTLVDGQWAYAVDFDEYEILTAANCGSFSTAGAYLQYPGISATVDRAGLVDIIRLAWTDVINASVWLLVVLVLEIDVRLQERHALEGLALKLSNLSKYVLYSILFLAAIYWGVKGDFVDFWDAFLWLVAFIFIELNVFEWRQEDAAAQNLASPASS
jgi:hypothetical protein